MKRISNGRSAEMQRSNELQYKDAPIAIPIPKCLLDSLAFAIKSNRPGPIIIKANIEKATMLCWALNSVYEYAETKVAVELSKRCRLGVLVEMCFDDRAELMTAEATSLLEQLVNVT